MRIDRLVEQAGAAARVRAYQDHPDVVALHVDRVRRVVDRLVWTAVILGLAFTAANVQHFAASGAPAGSLPWSIAWLLDPMVSLVVIGILLAEGVTSRWQIRTGWWVRTAKWFCLGATYAMNTWAYWADRDAAAIVLHSVPPLVVLVAAEAVTDLRDRLTEAALVAARRPAHGQTVRPWTRVDPGPPAPSGRAHPAADGGAPVSQPRDGGEPVMDPGTGTGSPARRPAEPSILPTPAGAAVPQPPAVGPVLNGARMRGGVGTGSSVWSNGSAPDVAAEPGGMPLTRPWTAASDRAPESGSPLFLAPSATVDTVDPADLSAHRTDGGDPDEAMRAYWEHSLACGRVPTGAELALVGGVSTATGKRRRSRWHGELAPAGPPRLPGNGAPFGAGLAQQADR